MKRHPVLKIFFVLSFCALCLYTIWFQELKKVRIITAEDSAEIIDSEAKEDLVANEHSVANEDIKGEDEVIKGDEGIKAENEDTKGDDEDTKEEDEDIKLKDEDMIDKTQESDNEQLKTSLNKQMENLSKPKPPGEVKVTKPITDNSQNMDTNIKGAKTTENLSNYDRLNATMKSKVPQFILGGVKKCGTGTLMAFTNQHPQIMRSQFTEYFVEEPTFQRGPQWFYEHMVVPEENRVVLERCNGCYEGKNSPERVVDMLGYNVKMIWMVRDPIDRLESEIAQHITNKDYISKPEDLLNQSDPNITELQMIQRGLYNVYLQRWLQYLPLENFLFIETSEFIKRPWVELNRLEKFMNVTSFFKEEMFIPREGDKDFYCIGNINLTSKQDIKCMGDGKGREHPKLDGAAVATLEKFFLPYNKAFFKQIGRSYKWRGTEDV